MTSLSASVTAAGSTPSAPIPSPYPPSGPAPSASAAPVATSAPSKEEVAQAIKNLALQAMNPSSASSSSSSSSASSSSSSSAAATSRSATLLSQFSGNSLMEGLASKLRELRSLFDSTQKPLWASKQITATAIQGVEQALSGLEREFFGDLSGPSSHASSGASPSSSSASSSSTTNVTSSAHISPSTSQGNPLLEFADRLSNFLDYSFKCNWNEFPNMSLLKKTNLLSIKLMNLRLEIRGNKIYHYALSENEVF